MRSCIYELQMLKVSEKSSLRLVLAIITAPLFVFTRLVFTAHNFWLAPGKAAAIIATSRSMRTKLTLGRHVKPCVRTYLNHTYK